MQVLSVVCYSNHTLSAMNHRSYVSTIIIQVTVVIVLSVLSQANGQGITTCNKSICYHQ